MISTNFVILGAFISLIGGISYLIETLKGKAKPNRITWFLWTLAPFVAFSAEIKQGVGILSLMTFMMGFSPLLVFVASFFNRKSEWKLGPFDFICGILSVIGIYLWYLSKNANIAIFFSILADGLAAFPTVLKSYSFPETESYYVYLAGFINAMLTLLAIKIWHFEFFAFPIYILFINVILVFLIKFRFRKK